MRFHLCRRREIDVFRRTSALLAETTDTTTDEPPGPSTRFRHPVPRARSQTPFRRPTKPRAAAKLPKIRDVPRRAKAQPSPCVWPPHFPPLTAFRTPSNRSKPPTQDRRRLSRYIRRWLVERLFAWIQWQRRILVRWQYHTQNFLGFVQLACLIILFRRF